MIKYFFQYDFVFHFNHLPVFNDLDMKRGTIENILFVGLTGIIPLSGFEICRTQAAIFICRGEKSCDSKCS